MFWLCKDQLTERIEREIDAVADDENALTLEQRTEQLAVISADKLACEREEERAFCAAVAGGAALTRRPDVDPRALLGLAGALPAPSR